MDKPIETYLAQYEGETRARLDRLRSLVHELAPEAQESINYGLMAYKHNGKPLVYFGAFAKHIGLYATPNGHAAFTDDFAPYKQGKGSVQLPLDQPLPEDLISRVILYRKEQTQP